MGKAGAYVLTHRAIMQKRQAYEQAKGFSNYFSMALTLLEWAECLPKECKIDGKPFRDFIDNQMKKDFPKALVEKDTLEIADKKTVRNFVVKYGSLIERTTTDYVHNWHLQGNRDSL